jgi:AraC-like DNA-binding protein
MGQPTQFRQSYFHTPSELAHDLFLTALRAGHVRAGSDYRVERRVCCGHDLLFCLRGRGYVMTGGRTFPVTAGQLAWINGHHPHAHWADAAEPWELLWARMDGPTLDTVIRVLRIAECPVFDLPRPPQVLRSFRRILGFMGKTSAVLEPLLHAELTAIVAALFEARQTAVTSSLGSGPAVPAAVSRTIDELSIYFYRQWRIEELARIAGMSVPQYFRCFRRATGSTPMSWLRRERISQAKRRLVESTDSVKEIAEQVGYSDQFHFSRDFKRSTGVAPLFYRQRERGTAA